MYAFNIIAQSIFNLLIPAALMFCVTWLLIDKIGAPLWLYAITLPLGIIIGLISMVKFAIVASKGLERLEQQGKNNNKTEHNNDKG